MHDRAELLPGTVELLVMRALAFGPAHGYAISRLIRNRSGDVLALEGPALYQALQRLEKDGLIDWEWGLSENNRKAKFYRLTPKGTARLKAQRKMWARFAEAMPGVLAPS